MEIIRVTENWQRAGVCFVRAAAMIREFGANLHMEFGEDTPETEYILVLDGDYPVSTCRLHYLPDHVGKIERVATLSEYRGKGCGALAIREAEAWMREKGVQKIFINSRTAVVGFYEKLGYTPDWSQKTGSGTFECVMTHKEFGKD